MTLSLLGLFALGIHGAARAAIAAFPGDRAPPPTASGRMHVLLAFVNFIALALAVGILTPSLIAQARWHGLAALLVAASILTIASVLLTFATLLTPLRRSLYAIFGLIERGIYVGAVLWLGCVILGLLR
jgi:hypothetical protein